MKLSSNQTYHLIQTDLKWDLMIINLATLVMISKGDFISSNVKVSWKLGDVTNGNPSWYKTPKGDLTIAGAVST